MAHPTAPTKRKSNDVPPSISKRAKKLKTDDPAIKNTKPHKKSVRQLGLDGTSRKTKVTQSGTRSEDWDAPKKAVARRTETEEDIIPLSFGQSTSKATNGSEKGGRRTSSKAASNTVIEATAKEFSKQDSDNERVDQAAALLAGFNTSSDEEDEDVDEPAMKELPEAPLTSEGKEQLDLASKKRAGDEPGTIYVGHIPHGFYDHQMKAYFSQFGTVSKLRMARNKRTGASKHFAFVEFESAAVADIVARTMDKYLMFNHILDVRVVPQDQLHPNLWKNHNRRFKVIPRDKIQARWLREPKTKEVWDKRISKEERKRKAKAAQLKELGYEFEMPVLKKVEDVLPSITSIEDQQKPDTVESAPEVLEKTTFMERTPTAVTVTETVTVKASKNTKKRKSVQAEGKSEDEPSISKKQRVKGLKMSKKKF